MRDSACRWLLMKILKYFEVMLKNVNITSKREMHWLVYVNKFLRIIKSCFLTEAMKRIKCQLLFFNFYTSYERKINFTLKIIIVITVIISLHCKETNWRYTNADVKICQYFRLHMKIIWWKFHIKTCFTLWDMCTWGMWKVCLQTFRNNRTC